MCMSDQIRGWVWENGCLFVWAEGQVGISLRKLVASTEHKSGKNVAVKGGSSGKRRADNEPTTGSR